MNHFLRGFDSWARAPRKFDFGGSASKSTNKSSFSGVDNTNNNTTFSQNGTQNTTATNPDWVTNGASGLYGAAQKLGATDPYSYVAGPSSLQTQAGTNASGLDMSPSGLGTANSYDTAMITQGKAPQTTGVQASGYIPQYMNPYTDSVVNATMNDFDANAGQTRAQQSLDMARSGAFGGSGAAINQSLTEGQLARARATQDSTLRSQGFDTALGAAQQDATRQQGANDLNANLHSQMQDRRLTAGQDLATNAATAAGIANQNIATQANVGGQLQQLQQAYATAPLEMQQWLQQQFSGLPLNLFTGQSVATNQSGTQNEVGTETKSGTQSGSGTNIGVKAGFSF